MEKLYKKIKLKSGEKRYISAIHGKSARLYKTASQAQAHALKLRERYLRLKAAEPKPDAL